MAARERVEFDVIGRDLGGSKAFKDVGDAADKAGDKIKDSGEKAKESSEKYRGLAHDIEQVQGNVRALAAEIDRTGNKDLIKDLDRQKRELRKLTRVKDLLPDDNESRREAVRFGGRLAEAVASGLATAGGPVSRVLGNVFGTLPPQAQAAIGAGIVGAAVAAGPALGAVVASAIVGAAGTGGIIGGIAIAAKDTRVQAAAKLTGQQFSSALEDAAVSFVPATVSSLEVVRSHIDEIGDDLKDAFSAISPKLPGLTEDFMAGATRGIEGFSRAVERSGPVLDVLGGIARQTGDLVADTLESMSAHAPEAADALSALWGVFELGVRSIVDTIEGLTVTYGWFEKIGAMLRGDTAELARLAAEQEKAKASGDGLSQGVRDLIDSFRHAGDETSAATASLRTWGDVVDEVAGQNISVEQANIRLEESIDRATEAAKRNGDGIDANIPKQRENRQRLIDIADATKAAAAATYKQTGSQERANEVAERGRQKFLATAHAMGVEKGEAERLANALFAIPNIDRTVTVEVGQALRSIAAVQQSLGKIKDRRVGVYYTVHGDLKLPGGTQLKGDVPGRASGGRIFGPGTDTSDSVLMRVSRGEYVLRAAAARTIGYDTLDQLNQADRRPVVRAGAAASPAGGGDGALLAELRRITRVLESLPIVRMDSGRQANIYSRTG